MGKTSSYTTVKNDTLFYKKDGKYYPRKKKSYAELNAEKKKKKDALGEIKMHTVVLNFTLTSTPTFQELNAMGTGNTRFSRIGNTIKSYSLQIKGIIEQEVIQDESIQTRMVLFIDWMNQGAAPVITDLFVSATEFNRNQPRLPASEKYVRFTFLMDKYITLSSNGVDVVGTGNIVYTHVINEYFKIKHKIYYLGSTAGVASLGKGCLWLLFSDRLGDNVLRISTVLKFTE